MERKRLVVETNFLVMVRKLQVTAQEKLQVKVQMLAQTKLQVVPVVETKLQVVVEQRFTWRWREIFK